jgi:hypothetical protein
MDTDSRGPLITYVSTRSGSGHCLERAFLLILSHFYFAPKFNKKVYIKTKEFYGVLCGFKFGVKYSIPYGVY